MQKKQMAKHDKAPAMNCRKVKDFPSNWPHLPFAQMVPSCSVALGTFRLKFQTKPLHVVLPRATGSCQHNPPMARLPATALAAASCIIVLGCGQRNTIQESRNWPKQNYFIILPKILQNTHWKNDISGRLEDIHYICCFPVPNLVPVCIVGLKKHRSCQKNSSTYLAKPMQKKQMAKHDKAPAMNCRKVPTPSALWTNGSILFVALGTFRSKFQSKPLHVVLPRATGSCQHNPPMARLPATALAAASGIIVLGCWAAEYHPRVPKLTQTKYHFIILAKILQNTHQKNDISGRLEDIHYICCCPVPNLVPVCIVGLNKHRTCQKNSNTYLAKPMQKNRWQSMTNPPQWIAVKWRIYPATDPCPWTNGSILFRCFGKLQESITKPLSFPQDESSGSGLAKSVSI